MPPPSENQSLRDKDGDACELRGWQIPSFHEYIVKRVNATAYMLDDLHPVIDSKDIPEFAVYQGGRDTCSIDDVRAVILHLLDGWLPANSVFLSIPTSGIKLLLRKTGTREAAHDIEQAFLVVNQIMKICTINLVLTSLLRQHHQSLLSVSCNTFPGASAVENE